MTGDPAVDAVLAAPRRRPHERRSRADYDVLTRFGDMHTAGDRRAGRPGPPRRSPSATSASSSTTRQTATCDLDTRRARTPSTPPASATRSWLPTSTRRARRSACAATPPPASAPRWHRPRRSPVSRRRASTCRCTGATETYCALDGGPLARLDAADVRIELTSCVGDRRRVAVRPTPLTRGRQASTLTRRWSEALSGSGPVGGGDDDVLEAHPPPPGDVDPGLDAERVAGLRAGGGCPRRCRGPRAPPCRCRGRCGG